MYIIRSSIVLLSTDSFIHVFIQLEPNDERRRQPHASALQHGIDSLTIQVHIPNKKENTNTSTSSSASASSTIHPHYADFTRCLEHLLRSISNLHERLHHSVSQYLLPSPTKFVSHGEYIYPGLLISIPMVIRAAILALRDIKRFQVKFVGYILAWDGLVSFGIGIVCVATSHQQQLLRENDAENTTNHEWMMKTVYFLSYAMIIFAMVTGRDGHQKGPSVRKVADEDEHYECQKSLRFVVCLLGVYLHAPLLLANYSLGLPSAVFWSPLLGTIVLSPSVRAFLSRNRAISLLLKIVGGMFLIATSPPVLLVPSIFPSYTVYILGVYTPLHLLLVVLWMM
jgi:glycosylphosphatidylinositol transamidase